ncbi:MAG: type I 3-dehydroquinate dehydratase [Promethearchaeota archaeon]
MAHTDPLQFMDRIFEATSMGADLIDLRVDISQVMTWKQPDVLLLNMVEISELPVVLSCKILGLADEGVTDIIRKIFSVNPAYVELPYFVADPLLDQLSPKELGNQTKIIVSRFLNEVGTLEELQTQVRQVADTGANIVKITSIANSLDDSLKILQLYPFARSLDIQLISFAYGRLGFISQIMAPFYGAEFTYAAIRGGDALMRVDALRMMLDGFSSLLFQTDYFDEDVL